MTKAWESKLNIALSELLCQMGIASRAEVIYKGRQDVLIYHQGLAVVLESSYSKQDAEADAKKRIEQLSADLAIAVHYPEDFQQDLREGEIKERLKHATMLAKPIVPEDFSETLFETLGTGVARTPDNWLTVDLNGLVELIREVGLFVISEEAVKKTEVAVGNLVDEFVTNLSQHNESASIAQNLHLWLNTTWGILTVLANRTETLGGWIRLKQSQWRLLPVLDVTRLSERRLLKLAEVFHQFRNKELPRIPEQFGTDGKVSQHRLELDSAFLRALGIRASEDDLRVLYGEVGSALTQWLGATFKKAPKVTKQQEEQLELTE